MTKEYHKIQTIYKRDSKTRKIIKGDYSMPEFEFLKDNLWVFSEKVDGTNIRVIWDGKDVIFGGKTDDAQIPAHLLARLQELFAGLAKKQLFYEIFTGKRVCLYGEGYGIKIQESGESYIPEGVDFVLFDIKIDEWWLERKNIEDIARKLGIKIVPVIGEGTLDDAVEIAKQGFKSQWGDFMAEGIVAKPKVELKSRKGERIISKIKHRDFQ